MSQEKVDKYKQEKANRKQNAKKEKVKQIYRRAVVGVTMLALVGWIGFSAYKLYDSSRPKQTAQVDYTAITEYQSELAAPVEE